MLNVAVVGSGPAGLYAAEALVKQAAALPVPVPVPTPPPEPGPVDVPYETPPVGTPT